MAITLRTRALIFLCLAVVGISFAAAFVRWADISASLSAFYRLLYGTLSLFVILLVLNIKNKKYVFLVKRPADLMKRSFIAGLFLGIDLYLWHESILLIGSGLSTVVANTQVFHTVIIGTLFLGEKLDWRWKIILPVAFFGVGLIAIKDLDFTLDFNFILGTGLAVVAGMLYSVFLYFTKTIRTNYDEIPSIVTWFYITFYTFVTVLVITVIEGTLRFDISLESHLYLFSLGLIATAISWTMISWSISILPLIKTSFILLGQPVLATIWGVIFFQEYLTNLQIVGVVITISMLVYGQFLKIRT
jgi:drug/metabolite transporter (DMT)-like permease